MEVSETKNLFFVCSHSLRHLASSNGAVGRPFLNSQHILLGHLHFLQCRSRSLISRDPAVLYLHHLQRCSEEDTVCGWFQSVPVTRTSCPSFKAEITCALSLLNRYSCKSGTYQPGTACMPWGHSHPTQRRLHHLFFYSLRQALYTHTHIYIWVFFHMLMHICVSCTFCCTSCPPAHDVLHTVTLLLPTTHLP